MWKSGFIPQLRHFYKYGQQGILQISNADLL